MKLAEVMNRAIREAKRQTRVAMPAEIVSFDGGSGLASVRIVLPELDSAGEIIEQHVIPAVPVSFPRGGGTSVTWPLSAGDAGIVLFADRDISGWASDRDTSRPDSDRMHALTDAMFIPGLGEGSTSDLVLRNGDIKITVTGGNVVIDGDVQINGSLSTTGASHTQGDVTTDGEVTAGGVALSTHTHPGDSGGTTGGPQ